MKIDFAARFKALFRKDKILLFLFSLLIAIILWGAIISYVNPNVSIEIKDVPVKINTSSQDAVSLSIVSGKVDTVNVTVNVPRNRVPSINAESFLAEIDLTGETKAGTYNKEITVTSKSEFVNITSVSPRDTTIVLDVSVTKILPLTVDDGGYNAPEGYYLGTPTLSTDAVKISGPKGVVDAIQSAGVSVEIPDGSVGIIDFKDCAIQLYDANKQPIPKDTLTLDVENITVSIPVIKTKVVPLVIEYKNAPKFTDGFYDLTYSVDGNVIDDFTEIEIAAIDEVFDDITSISLGAFDFKNIHTKEHTEEFTVNMPSGATNISGVSTVSVTVKFKNLSVDTVTVLPKNIRLSNVPSGKNATITSKSVRVNICGSPAAIKAVKEMDLTAVVSLEGAVSGGIREYPVSVSFGDINNIWVYSSDGASVPVVNIQLK